MTLTSEGFSKATTARVASNNFSKSSSDLWCRCHHCSFCRYCYIWKPTKSVLCARNLRTLSLLGLQDSKGSGPCAKFPFKLHWQGRTMPCGPISGQRRKKLYQFLLTLFYVIVNAVIQVTLLMGLSWSVWFASCWKSWQVEGKESISIADYLTEGALQPL